MFIKQNSKSISNNQMVYCAEFPVHSPGTRVSLKAKHTRIHPHTHTFTQRFHAALEFSYCTADIDTETHTSGNMKCVFHVK